MFYINERFENIYTHPHTYCGRRDIKTVSLTHTSVHTQTHQHMHTDEHSHCAFIQTCTQDHCSCLCPDEHLSVPFRCWMDDLWDKYWCRLWRLLWLQASSKGQAQMKASENEAVATFQHLQRCTGVFAYVFFPFVLLFFYFLHPQEHHRLAEFPDSPQRGVHLICQRPVVLKTLRSLRWSILCTCLLVIFHSVLFLFWLREFESGAETDAAVNGATSKFQHHTEAATEN